MESMSFQKSMQTLNSINTCPPAKLGQRRNAHTREGAKQTMLESVARGRAYVLVSGEWVSAPDGRKQF